jgi:hypothetical protein
MWENAMTVGSILWVLVGTYLVYAFGMMILHGAWHAFVFATILFFLCMLEVAITATQV